MLVLELRGEFGSLGWDPEFEGLADSVRAALRGLPRPRMVVDVSRVRYGGSEFLRFLLSLKKRIRAVGGQMVLAGARGQVAQVLRVTKLDRVLLQRSTVESATAETQVPPSVAVCG